MQNSISDRVSVGVAFMDQLFPDGWENKINLDTVDISSDCHCILGQTFGSFSTVATNRKLSPERSRELGFFEFEGPKRNRRYRRLTAGWKQAILARKELAAA